MIAIAIAIQFWIPRMVKSRTSQSNIEVPNLIVMLRF
jgi:hypothetical protein